MQLGMLKVAALVLPRQNVGVSLRLSLTSLLLKQDDLLVQLFLKDTIVACSFLSSLCQYANPFFERVALSLKSVDLLSQFSKLRILLLISDAWSADRLGKLCQIVLNDGLEVLDAACSRLEYQLSSKESCPCLPDLNFDFFYCNLGLKSQRMIALDRSISRASREAASSNPCVLLGQVFDEGGRPLSECSLEG